MRISLHQARPDRNLLGGPPFLLTRSTATRPPAAKMAPLFLAGNGDQCNGGWAVARVGPSASGRACHQVAQ